MKKEKEVQATEAAYEYAFEKVPEDKKKSTLSLFVVLGDMQ